MSQSAKTKLDNAGGLPDLQFDLSDTKNKHAADSAKKTQIAADSSVPTAPDGGWGWVVLFASFFVSLIVDGICYTFGIIKTELSNHFDATSSATAWAGSLCAGCYLLVGPVASALSNYFGCRLVCMVGGAMAGIFFLISGFSDNLEMLIITYGIIGGIGFGLMYLPSIVMVGYYFDKKRALATGITVCGSSVGIFVMAPFASILVQAFSWRGTNIILGGLILNGIFMGALYRPLTNEAKSDDTAEENYVIESIKKEKRNRTYSVDDRGLAYEGPEVVSKHPINGTIQHSSESLSSRKAESIHLMVGDGSSTNLDDNDIDRRERRRSRQMSKASCGSLFKEEKKPFDRQDALFTGNLLATREFKEAGSMQAYVNSMASIHKERTDGYNDKPSGKKSLCSAVGRIMGEMFDVSLLKSPTFIIICVTGFIVYLGLYTPFVYSVAKAEDLGASQKQASFILVLIGIGNTVSRIATGYVSDLPCVDSVMVYNIAAILAGAVTCLVAVFNTYELLMMYGALFGVTIAAFITLRSIIIVDLLGIEKLNNGFGLMCLSQGIAAIIGSPISGLLYDATGSYSLPFIVSGLMLAFGGILCLPIRRVARWEQSRRNRQAGFSSEPSTAVTTPS